jgi:hypothetical protein
MPEKKVRIFVKSQKKVRRIPTSFLKELKLPDSDLTGTRKIQELLDKNTPHFEVHHTDGTKTLYWKSSYEQNFNKKRVKI